MCGIIFAINNDPYALNLDDWFTNAILASQVRGTHSAGLFQVDNKHDLRWVKDGVNPTTFVKESSAAALLSSAPSSAITVGHVRAATVGNVSKENAHPFISERADNTFVAVVHNGTLQNWRSHKDAKDYDVDSAWLAHMLATEGHDAFEYFTGAFAIVWYDSAHPGSLFMARNKERPLHFMVANEGKTILGCSELGMLGWLSERHDFELYYEGGKDSPYYLEDGKIYKFSTTDIGNFTVVDYPKYVPKPAPVTYTPIDKGFYGTRHNAPWNDTNYMGTMGDDDLEDWYGAGYSSRGFSRVSDYEEQEQLLAGVKKALRGARNETTTHSNPIATVDESVMQAAAPVGDTPLERGITDPIDCGAVILSSVSTANATYAERESAKQLKVFGMVIRFSGVIHDPSTSTLLGTFSVYEDRAWREYDGEMRFVPTAVAKQYIEDETGTQLAAICGMSSVGNNQMAVVQPLTEDQLEFMRDYEEAMANPATARAS